MEAITNNEALREEGLDYDPSVYVHEAYPEEPEASEDDAEEWRYDWALRDSPDDWRQVGA